MNFVRPPSALFKSYVLLFSPGCVTHPIYLDALRYLGKVKESRSSQVKGFNKLFGFSTVYFHSRKNGWVVVISLILNLCTP